MSALQKGLANLAVMHMITRVNHERINACPPGLDYEVEDPEHMKNLIDNAKHGAYKYDNYNDILQISFTYGGMFMHFVWCEDEPRVINNDNTIITVSADEYGMIRDAIAFISSVHQEIDDTVVQAAVFAGWNLKEKMWPMLLNKAFAYDLFVPHSLLSDPFRKFQTIDYLLEVGVIYSQGAWGGIRPLPALPDALTFWGYGDRDKYPTINTSTICTDPAVAAGEAEIYLRDLKQVISDYYSRS